MHCGRTIHTYYTGCAFLALANRLPSTVEPLYVFPYDHIYNHSSSSGAVFQTKVCVLDITQAKLLDYQTGLEALLSVPVNERKRVELCTVYYGLATKRQNMGMICLVT